MIVATADWHLGKRQYGLSRREKDFYKAAKKLILSIPSKSIVFNAGDIFDTASPKFEAIKTLKEINDILIKNKSVMYYIEGNHDRAPNLKDNSSDFKHWTNLFEYKDESGNALGIVKLNDGIPIYNTDENFVVVGFKEQPKQNLIDALTNYDYSAIDSKLLPNMRKVLLLHMSCKEFCSFAKDTTLSIKEIPNIKFWDFIIIGDTHIFDREINKDTYILSPGSIEMVSSSEPIDKYAWVLNLKDKGLDNITVATRPTYQFFIRDGNEITDDLVTSIKDIASENPLIYLEVPDDVIGLNRIYKYLNLDQAILRIKFIKTNKTKTHGIEIVDDDTEEVMSLDTFKENYLKANPLTLDDFTKKALEDISRKEADADVSQIIDSIINMKQNNDTSS